MSRFKNEIAHLQAHIKTLRLGAGALVIVALVMGGGWWSAPRDRPSTSRPTCALAVPASGGKCRPNRSMRSRSTCSRR